MPATSSSRPSPRFPDRSSSAAAASAETSRSAMGAIRDRELGRLGDGGAGRRGGWSSSPTPPAPHLPTPLPPSLPNTESLKHPPQHLVRMDQPDELVQRRHRGAKVVGGEHRVASRPEVRPRLRQLLRGSGKAVTVPLAGEHRDRKSTR